MVPASKDGCPRCPVLEARIGELEARLAVLERMLFGKRSEKMPPVGEELKNKAAKKERPARQPKERAQLPEEEVFHRVAEEDRTCKRCGGDNLTALGSGKRTSIIEYIPARFICRIHVQETLRCACGEHVVTAKAPPRAIEQGHYGAGFIAHLITAKCADSIPLYRLEKEYARLGVPISRSTMTSLFHAAAERLAPLSSRLLELVAGSEVVQADETTVRVQELHKCRIAYIWVFRADKLIAFRFSPSRSGSTPREVLGGGAGTLVVDGYTGYNHVVKVDGWKRAGCLAHARRKFFDARSTAQDASDEAMQLILEVYRVEHEAKERGITRTEEHLQLRQSKGRKAMDMLHGWLERQKPLHPPKSPIGKAISYTLTNWDALTCFLEDVRLPPDNNASESALRRVALGRKNYLFVGHDQAGENIAGLYSLVATCEANHVNPLKYLTDVLIRVQTHSASRIDELLPHQWKSNAESATSNAA